MAKHPLILVIDHTPVLRDAVTSLLQESGFKVRHAGDYDEALSALGDDDTIDGIAVAWELPDGTCMKLLKRILSRGEFEGGLVVYDCPKPRAAEDKLEEWSDGVEYVVIEAPADAEGIVEALAEIVE